MKYALIELRGVIGEDIHASGLREALDGIRSRKIENVLFDIDSVGGHVSEMHEILRVLDEHQSALRYITRVRRALSAAVPIAFTCDALYFETSGTIGAAVPYATTGTGSIEVDAKLASAFGAEIASRGAPHGIHAALCEAMADMPREVWVVRGQDHNVDVYSQQPTGLAGDLAEQIDGPRTVLTLSASMAVEFGIGSMWESRDGFDDSWTDAGAFARRAMDKAAKDYREQQSHIADVIAWASKLPELAAEAQRLESRIAFVALSQSERPERMRRYDAAIDAWTTVQKGAAQIDAKVRKVRGHQFDQALLADVHRIASQADAAVARLRQGRLR